MAWKFRKRIKIAPGISINLSKSGVSTTIGPKGASVNIGKKGVFLNSGIPGTGIYDRQRLGGGPKHKQGHPLQGNPFTETPDMETPVKEWSELTKWEKVGRIALIIASPFLLILTACLWLVAHLGDIFKFLFTLFMLYVGYKLFFS